MKRVRMATGMLVALIALTVTAFAQPGEGRCDGKGKHGPRGEGPLAVLNLTDTQKEQVKALRDQFEQDNATLLEQMKGLHEQAREQMQSGDKAGAKATHEQMKGLHGQFRQAEEGLRAEIDALLTDEQKAKLQEMKAKHEGKRGNRGRKGEELGKKGAKGTPPNID